MWRSDEFYKERPLGVRPLPALAHAGPSNRRVFRSQTDFARQQLLNNMWTGRYSAAARLMAHTGAFARSTRLPQPQRTRVSLGSASAVDGPVHSVPHRADHRQRWRLLQGPRGAAAPPPQQRGAQDARTRGSCEEPFPARIAVCQPGRCSHFARLIAAGASDRPAADARRCRCPGWVTCRGTRASWRALCGSSFSTWRSS
jgi:hypothetical protein